MFDDDHADVSNMPNRMKGNLKPEPCRWIADLDDVLSKRGREVVARIRRQCQCQECRSLREGQQ